MNWSPRRFARSARPALLLTVPVMLGMLTFPGAGVAAAPSYNFDYGGATSQGHPFHLSLTGNSGGYRLFVSWYDTYSPSACNQDLLEPRTTLRVATVHLHGNQLALTGAIASPRSVLPHKVTLDAVLTKGKVVGSFEDTSGSQGRTGRVVACATGHVTFTATRL